VSLKNRVCVFLGWPRPVELLLVFVLFLPAASLAQNVLTYHNDNARTGQNLRETTLKPSNVNSTSFGKLFVLSVDGKVDAQPLYLSALAIPGEGTHNVLFVATEHDSVYAFDADTGTTLWQVSMLGSGETVSDNRGCQQVIPEIGITATPVIDPTSGPHGSIYVVTMSKDGSGNYFQRLHALDVTTGQEEFGGPVNIQAKFPGTGDNSQSGMVIFDPSQYKERPGLLLLNHVVITTWSSHCDFRPYTGWIIGYHESTLAQVGVLNITPNGSQGAIWASGAGPAADTRGNIYILDANGTFDTTLDSNGFPSRGDYGNAFLKLSTSNKTLAVADYFNMFDTVNESDNDMDLGSGGALVLPDMIDAHGHTRHLAVGAGKDTNIYLVDRDNMGKFNPNNDNKIYQELDGALSGEVRAMPAYFNGQIYYGSVGNPIRAFRFSNARLQPNPVSQTSTAFPSPGATPSISAYQTRGAILWATQNTSPAVLHAYDATNLANELYNTHQAPNGRDNFGDGNKFITPTIAHGKVYVGTTNGVGVFGLLPFDAPVVSLFPSELAAPPQLLHTSVSHNVSLTNVGTAGLTISGFATSGEFSQTNNCVSSLGAGASCVIDATFTPTKRGIQNGAVTITDNAAGSPQHILLSGIGTAVQLVPTSLNFGSQKVGTTSAPQTVTLTNVDVSPVIITRIRLTGANTSDFVQENTCGRGVGTGGNCTIRVTFTPTAAGARSAAISIIDNGGASPQTVALSGTGTP